MAYIGCGREVGRINENEYCVGSLFDYLMVDKQTFLGWILLRASSTYEEFEKNVMEKGLFQNPNQGKEVFNYFVQKRLVLELDTISMENQLLADYTITKNGCMLQIVNKNEYILGAMQPTKVEQLTEREYLVWSAPTGITTIPETIGVIQKRLQVSESEAVQLFKDNCIRLVACGLWAVEYAPKERKPRVDRLFERSTVGIENKVLVPLGDDVILPPDGKKVGLFPHNWEPQAVVINNQTAYSLNETEYAVWKLFKSGATQYKEVADLFPKYQADVHESFLSVYQKGLLAIWEEEGNELMAFGLSFQPKGIGYGWRDNGMKAVDALCGTEQSLPPELYLLWTDSHGYAPLIDVVSLVSEATQFSMDDSGKVLFNGVPALIHRGLGTLHAIEN